MNKHSQTRKNVPAATHDRSQMSTIMPTLNTKSAYPLVKSLAEQRRSGQTNKATKHNKTNKIWTKQMVRNHQRTVTHPLKALFLYSLYFTMYIGLKFAQDCQ